MDQVAQRQKYERYKRPPWAPPSWAFGVMWPILYFLMFVSFGYVFLNRGIIPDSLFYPIVLNIVANVIYTFLQFGTDLKWLATFDVIVLLATLLHIVPTAISIPELAWIGWMNIPYLLWVSYALTLQVWISIHN